MTDIAKDIGLEDDLITNETGQSYIFAKINCILYQVVRLWASQLILNRFKTRLISPIGKLRAGLDLVIPQIKLRMIYQLERF